MRKKIKKSEEKAHPCRDCVFCEPITTMPNLNWERKPFLNTCDKQPYERMMNHDYGCKFFKAK